jgi:small subunit ribosomal protein S3e
MKPFDPEGRQGPSKNLPDAVTLVEPKPEAPIEIRSEHKDPPVQAVQPPAQQQQEAPAAEEGQY